MKPVQFEYARPATLPDAVALLGRKGRATMPLAGGQTLVAELNRRAVRPGLVVDLNRIPGLAEIEYIGDTIRIGAMARLAALANDPHLDRVVPVLSQAAALVANPGIRSRSTVGGCLCHADPAAELPAVLLALDARIHIQSRKRARIAECDHFLLGAHQTDLAPGELVVAVEFDRPRLGFEFAEVSRGAMGPPLVAACCGLCVAEGAVIAARIVASGVAERPIRLYDAETALVGLRIDRETAVDSKLAAALTGVLNGIEPPPDHSAPPTYRRALLRTVLIRALSRAAEHGGQLDDAA